MQKQDNTNKFVLFTVIAIIITLVVFPIFTNLLMFTFIPKSLKFLAPEGISENPIWIGFFATFFGATIGGLISGLFTFIGVKKTISIQEQKENEKQRTTLELHEIFNGSYLLRNIRERNGRLIITNQYEYIIKEQLENGYFNYILISNGGPGKALNCSVEFTITYEASQDNFTTEVFIPVIYEKENIYIPFDRIIDENQNALNPEDLYRLTHILITYETSAKETIKIERILEIEQGNYKTTDFYSIKSFNEKEFKSLFELKGTNDSWYNLRDLNN